MNRSRPGLPPAPPWWAMARSRGVPWWGAVCSAAAPVLLAVGSTIGGHLQPRPYNAMTGTVSALAALGAADRWVMTLAFAAARRRGLSVPWGLRPRVSAAASVLLLGVLLWFGAELLAGAGLDGLAERVLGGTPTLWPPLVVLSCRRGQARDGASPGDAEQDIQITAIR